MQALFIRVNFALEYFIANELQNNISNATDPTVKRVHRAILQRIIQQAKHHYEDYVDVITEWEGNIKDDLMKTLPSQTRPTSLSELDIRNRIGMLVSDW